MSEFKSRRYACMQWPFLRLSGPEKVSVRFERGFFTATTEAEANVIESNESFGKQIFPIKWEPKPVPSQAGPVESLIESEIVSALAEQQPRVRRGKIGTK